MKKSLVVSWFLLCLFLFGIVLHPQDLQKFFPSIRESIQSMHNVVRPLFYRASHL